MDRLCIFTQAAVLAARRVRQSLAIGVRFLAGLCLMLVSAGTATAAAASFPQPYCEWSTSNVVPITRVDFAGFANNSGSGSGQPALEDFTSVVGSVAAGETPTINVEADFGGGFPPYPIRVTVFVDWNLDGDFDDSDERFDLGWLQGSGSNGSQSGPIHVPLNVVDGVTRMRVVAAGMSSGTPQSCGNADKGQAEDYTLNIAAKKITDGDLDTNFGDNGLALSGIGDTGGHNGGLAMQPDGKIVICATRSNTGSSSEADFFVARFTRDGILDSTFSFDGKVTIDFQQGVDLCRAVALQPDGRIVVAGASADASGNYDFAVARLGADGTLDASFGAGSGKQLVPFDHGGGNVDVATDVVVQKDGRIVVAGYAYGPTANNRDMAIVRLLADGTRDTTFNLSGRLLIGFEPNGSFESDDEAESVAVDSAGRIVIAGNVNSSDLGIVHDFAVARVLPDGQLDANFDADGRATMGFDIVPDSYDLLQSMLLDHAGRLVLVGQMDGGTPTTRNIDMAIARLLPDGSPDSDFGMGGMAHVPFDLDPQGSDLAHAVVEQSNGKLLIAGTANHAPGFDAGIARINPDGTLDAQFGTLGHETFDVITGGGTQAFSGIALQGSAIIAAGQASLADSSQVDNFIVRLDSGLIFANGFE